MIETICHNLELQRKYYREFDSWWWNMSTSWGFHLSWNYTHSIVVVQFHSINKCEALHLVLMALMPLPVHLLDVISACYWNARITRIAYTGLIFNYNYCIIASHEIQSKIAFHQLNGSFPLQPPTEWTFNERKNAAGVFGRDSRPIGWLS